MMYYQHQLPHHLILIIYVRAHWQQYEFLITQLQHGRMWACSKMHRFTTKWCTFVLSQADWIILWLQASVAWYYIHEQEGSVRQGKTCWSGTTWTSFSKILPEQRGELKQHGHMRDVLQSAEKPKTSQFGPIRICTSTALHNSVFERLPLRMETNNHKKILSTTLLTWTTVIPHCVTECSTLPYLLQAPRILCLLFPLQDWTGCTCSVFSKPRVGAKQGQRTHTITAKIYSKWRRTKVISALARFPH